MTKDKDEPKDEPKDELKAAKAKRDAVCADCRMEAAAYTCAGCGGRVIGHICKLAHEAQGHTLTAGVAS